MRRLTTNPRLVNALGLLAAGLLTAAEPWQVRYAQQPDQKPEWTVQGYTPGWALAWVNRQTPEVTWTDTATGDCRGWLIFGRPVAMGEPQPVELSLRFDYTTHCAMDEPTAKRSGVVYALVLTPEAWAAFATAPSDAKALTAGHPPSGCVSALVQSQGDDVDEWRDSGQISFPLLPSQPGTRELVVAVAWGAYHYGCEEHGGLRNVEVTTVTQADKAREFWQALDSERPELRDLAAAVRARDEAGAGHALATHLRQRPTPVVGNPVAPADDAGLRRADDVLARTYRLAGCPAYTFAGDVVWNADPFHYDQWAIALNRHSEWCQLAAAYRKTGDAKYAGEWARQVDSWVAAMPVFIGPHWIEGPFNAAGKSPLSLDAGIRMGQTWFPSFLVFRESPAVSDAAIVRFVRSCWQHAQYLMRDENFKHGSNWGAMEANGLYHLGVMLPEFRSAARWREVAMARLCGEIEAQVYPDGAQTELSPGYHGVSLNNFLGAMHLARANNLPLPDGYVAGLERMFDCLLRIAMPDLRLPALNDSGRQGCQGYFRAAVELFPNRPDFRWAFTSRREGQPPDYLSTVQPWAGRVVMRTDWTADAAFLLFDAGPFGTGHQHEDALGIVLCALGHELLADAGNYAYDTSAWRRYVLSTRAHSTVRIDGHDQACRSAPETWRATSPDQHGFRTDAFFDYACATHRAGYAPPVGRAVVHRRRVLFVKPDYWLVVDELRASDGKERTAEAQFLVNAGGAEIVPESLVALGEPAGPRQARLAMLPLVRDGVSARVVQGQTQPEVLGFLPEGYEKLRPVPAVLYTTRFQDHALLAWALVPFTGAACPLQIGPATTTAGVIGVQLTTASGAVHQLSVSPTRLTVETPSHQFAAAEEPLP